MQERAHKFYSLFLTLDVLSTPTRLSPSYECGGGESEWPWQKNKLLHITFIQYSVLLISLPHNEK
jgi:hypothetical protein